MSAYRFESLVIAVSVLLSGTVLAGFIELTRWDNYVVEGPALKIKEWIGWAKSADFARLAEICLERRLYSCAETEYARLAPEDPQYFARLGHLQAALGETSAALESFRAYFAHGEKDPEVAYQLAIVLGKLGRIDEAAAYFDFVIKSNPQRFLVTVTRNYANFLLRAGRVQQAEKLILHARAKEGEGSLFMAEELSAYSSDRRPAAARVSGHRTRRVINLDLAKD